MEPTFAEAKAAVDALNTAFSEFRAANDARLKQIESKGVADPLIQSKLDRINADIEKFSAVANAYAELEAKVNRAQLAGGGDTKSEQQRAYDREFVTYLRKGDHAIDSKAMSVGSDPDGGYTVSADMSGRIIAKIFETSPVRSIASVTTTSSDRIEGLRDTDEATAAWVAETGSRGANATPTLAKWEIVVHEQFSNNGVTQKLLDDTGFNIEQWLADKVSDKFARAENTAFVTGSGVGRPRGFASYTTVATGDASRSWGELEHVVTGTSGGWGAAPNGSDKLVDLVHKMKSGYRQGSVFAMNKVTLGSARQLKANGEYIWLPSMEAGQPSKLLGYPVVELEDMATYTTADALAVAFGNFSAGYQIVDRIGIRTLRDPYTNKPYVQFYSTKRVGGDVVNFEAIKFLKFGA